MLVSELGPHANVPCTHQGSAWLICGFQISGNIPRQDTGMPEAPLHQMPMRMASSHQRTFEPDQIQHCQDVHTGGAFEPNQPSRS